MEYEQLDFLTMRSSETDPVEKNEKVNFKVDNVPHVHFFETMNEVHVIDATDSRYSKGSTLQCFDVVGKGENAYVKINRHKYKLTELQPCSCQNWKVYAPEGKGRFYRCCRPAFRLE